MSPELFYGNYTTGADGRLYARGGLRDCLSVWGSLGPFDVNTASPALMEAMGMQAEMAASIVATRELRPLQDARRSRRSTAAAHCDWFRNHDLYTARQRTFAPR